MKRLMYFTMCLCTLLVAMSACSSKNANALIGKWEQTISQNGVKAVVTYDFKDNGKLVQTMVMKNSTPAINIDAEGTCDYTYADDKITFKFSPSDFTFNKFEIEGLDESYADAAMEEMKSSMVDMEQEFDNVKIDGDKLTANFNGQKVELKRL